MFDVCKEQLLHIVVGGDLVRVDPGCVEFRNLADLHFVGAFPNYAEARAAWKGASQQNVDNAHRRYFIIHAHRLIDPTREVEFPTPIRERDYQEERRLQHIAFMGGEGDEEWD